MNIAGCVGKKLQNLRDANMKVTPMDGIGFASHALINIFLNSRITKIDTL
jgi:hypothetical protein